MSSARPAAIIFIFFTVLLDVIALGLIIPVMPKLMLGFAGNTAEAARLFGLFGTAWAVMQFFAAPFLGAVSDRFGRRPVILLSNFGLGMDYVLMAWAPTLNWLFLGRVISGVTSASIPTAFAYISDVTTPEKRAASFGIVGAAFGAGFILGPALGGLLGAGDPRFPFWVAAGLSLLNACYGFFVLPESLAPERRGPFRLARANPVGSLRLLASHRQLLGLASVIFLSYLAHDVLPSVFVLYATHRYQWDERVIGLTLAGVGLCSMIVSAALVRPVVARFRERATLVAALLFGVAGFAVYGWAATGAAFWFGVPLVSLWGMAGPSAQGLMTILVSPSEQGQLQGAISGMRSVTGLLGPGLFTGVFAMFIAPGRQWQLPGAPFLVASLLLLGAALLAVRVTRPHATRAGSA